jgi:hypothetical protein
MADLLEDLQDKPLLVKLHAKASLGIAGAKWAKVCDLGTRLRLIYQCFLEVWSDIRLAAAKAECLAYIECTGGWHFDAPAIKGGRNTEAWWNR